MSDKELEAWKDKVGTGAVMSPGEAHGKALRAVGHPVRRAILERLKENAWVIEELANDLNLDVTTLRYHLKYLQDIYYITVDDANGVDLTPIGVAYTRHVIQ
ncbi:MAG TPA: winged helix-turn-helix domain-containing protein [Candidatus Lokiarchaeia archaeon]|nr:winged helix-turn-helix domain-containing protein [Candidatus Lokiarchaeia archaeon]